jgi:hypothetical protein
MPLSNNAQAILLSLSAFFLALGTAAAAIPEWLPFEIRYYVAAFFWICGIIGFALKEAVGGTPPADAVSQWTIDDLRSAHSMNLSRIAGLEEKIGELTKTDPQAEPPPEPEQPEQNPS